MNSLFHMSFTFCCVAKLEQMLSNFHLSDMHYNNIFACIENSKFFSFQVGEMFTENSCVMQKKKWCLVKLYYDSYK